VPLDGARTGAPAAIQFAGRFHLWQNLAEAAGKTVLAVLAMTPASGPQTAEAAASADGPAPAPGPPAVPDGFRDVHGHERRLAARHRDRYAAVQALRARGLLRPRVARRLELARGTAATFASAASIGEPLVKATSRPTIPDPFQPCPGQRQNDGITSAAALHAEIRARGRAGNVQLASYAWGAANVIFAVGAQKLVPTLAAAHERVYQHSLPLEDARAQAAYGQHSQVGKILEIHQELPGRIHIVLMRQQIGF
jgi:hypothetical protein